MKHTPYMALVIIALLTGGPVLIGAEITVTNPGIPSYERVEYQEIIDGKKQLSENILSRKSENGRDFYELRVKSSDSESLYRIDPMSLLSFFSDITTKTPEATIRRTSEIISARPKLKADDLVVSDLGILGLTLRGFPFEGKKFANLVFLGSSAMGNTGFNFELKLLGKETVKLASGSYECYKLEMGLSGFLGTFVAPTRIWFSTKAPHIMVKSEGVQGPPGSPLRIMELLSYSTSP